MAVTLCPVLGDLSFFYTFFKSVPSVMTSMHYLCHQEEDKSRYFEKQMWQDTEFSLLARQPFPFA